MTIYAPAGLSSVWCAKTRSAMLSKRKLYFGVPGGGIVAPEPWSPWRRSVHADASPKWLAGAWSWNRLCAVCGIVPMSMKDLFCGILKSARCGHRRSAIPTM